MPLMPSPGVLYTKKDIQSANFTNSNHLIVIITFVDIKNSDFRFFFNMLSPGSEITYYLPHHLPQPFSHSLKEHSVHPNVFNVLYYKENYFGCY